MINCSKKILVTLKNSWSIIKSVINKNKSVTSVSKFRKNWEITTDNEAIASFDKFCINIGPNLAAQIPSSLKSPTSYIEAPNLSSVFHNPVTSEEISSIIKSLKNSSAGRYSIGAKEVISTYQKYISVLTHAFNLSIVEGAFPKEFKIARVIPLFKSDNCMLVINYRPVSVLPLFRSLRYCISWWWPVKLYIPAVESVNQVSLRAMIRTWAIGLIVYMLIPHW